MPVYSVNKKARFDYEILDTLEAGLVLTGPEVKSIRSGGAKLTGGFVTFHGNTALLTNAHIPKYAYSGRLPGYEPEHSRKLLLTQKELNYIRGKSQEQGLTIIPLSLYTRGRRIKLEIGVARGKKKYDKRRTIKERETGREVRRAVKEGK
ncbi:MAG: SsrA-binding protein [Candidatus Magasanikbacteria bacterium RIFCSPHIGHO2_02_FULL_51_14]|uniref:SsrA-binding protein n=1 Tax=Candidatus Magasanikbacteria bacterium RIFCSPHIGHO2_02_FULL_51_14 TaxID=1798683 RepID=A0A1F6MDU0_9BACT|nr:MAG: SsrA-binding protein [Candidatus Magasanikbacteria bacterium RIFCSPHIGHO2_02_FULL_51_14]